MPQTATPGRSSEARTVADVGTTLNSAALTGPAGAFHEEDVGRTITHANLPAGTTITAVASDTAATASANATVTGTASATLGLGTVSAYGFTGWAPETDAESETYSVSAVNAGATQPGKITGPNQQREQRHRA